MRLKLPGLTAAALAGAGLLAGCGGSPAAAAPAATRTAAAAAVSAPASTPPSALAAPALVADSLAALRSGVSVRVDTADVSQNGIADSAGDLTANGGRDVLTAPTGAKLTNLFVGGVAYLQGNALGLTRFAGVSASFAQRYAGQWIAIKPGDQVGYASYDNIASELTLSGMASSTALAAPEQLTGAASAAGQPVLGVSGPPPAGLGLPTGTQETLYVAADTTLRPVQEKEQGGGITATTTFSHWGEQVDLSTPPDSLPAATLPPST